MEIENYEITSNGEIITFRRQYIEESGKENCCYALWQDDKSKHLKFGLVNARKTYGIGLSINDNYDLIVQHLNQIIEDGKVNVIYRYIPAPPEEYGNGVVYEVIPTEIETERAVSQEVIIQFRQIIAILQEYKEVMVC